MPFFFNDTATTEIYTLSLHDALPISTRSPTPPSRAPRRRTARTEQASAPTHSPPRSSRSEEHTSELQSHSDLVCRLLLEKKTQNRRFVRRSASYAPATSTPSAHMACV